MAVAAATPRRPSLTLVLAGALAGFLLLGSGCGDEPAGLASFSPVWSPDGRSLAYVVDPKPSEGCPYGSCLLSRYEIWTARANGSGARRLARGTAPAWSPDGRTLAFLWSGASAADDRSGIATIRADGSKLRLLTSLLSHPNRRGPSWSPDGKRIVFASWGWFSEPNRLFVIKADGSNRRRLTRLQPYDAAWSPDGSRIAFITLNALYTIKPDGSGPKRIYEQGCSWSFAWSRDSSKLVCDTDDPGFAIIARDGRLLLGPDRRVPGDSIEASATLSPDGRRVSFERREGETSEIYLADADGSNPRRLAAGTEPAWSPDGSRIAFSANGHIYLINPDGSDLHHLR